MIPLLAPIFQGEWAPYGETLACAPHPPPDAVRVADLLADPPRLLALLRLKARTLNMPERDLRAVASAWSMNYLHALLPPVAAAASLLQHGFPVTPEQVWVSLDDADGDPECFHIVELGTPRPGTDTAARYDVLLWTHLAPLFARLTQLTRLAPKILWGNAVRYLEPVLEEGLRMSGQAPAVAADLEHLLHRPTWPQPCGEARDNPMFMPARRGVRVADRSAPPVTLHRQCCLYYLVPRLGYCGACPLSPEFERERCASTAD
ncbi:Ferric iron reductase protein FhuF [compost metagenome]